MNEIVIGVKPLDEVGIAEQDKEAKGAIGAMWVTHDGKLIADGTENMVSVQLLASADPLIFSAKGRNPDEHGGFLEVDIKLFCSSFRTVRWDGPEAPERFRKTTK